jgi:hypothetical protein
MQVAIKLVELQYLFKGVDLGREELEERAREVTERYIREVPIDK